MIKNTVYLNKLTVKNNKKDNQGAYFTGFDFY